MAEKLITKKSFIGGRIVLPGETVDVDDKGQLAPAASTPIGSLTTEQLRVALAARERGEADTAKGGKSPPKEPAAKEPAASEAQPAAPSSAAAPEQTPGTEPKRRQK